MRIRVGADLKMGIGSNLTLDATINPDFGQVDGDPAVVNLSGFETVFDERRPFFTEGSQILSGNGRQGPNYYYSRRIGAPPHGYPTRTTQTSRALPTILGAGKLTGRLSSGLSVGALGALTSREHAATYDVADRPIRRDLGRADDRLRRSSTAAGSRSVGVDLRTHGHGRRRELRGCRRSDAPRLESTGVQWWR